MLLERCEFEVSQRWNGVMLRRDGPGTARLWFVTALERCDFLITELYRCEFEISRSGDGASSVHSHLIQQMDRNDIG